MNENEFEYDGKVYVADSTNGLGCKRCAFVNEDENFCNAFLPHCGPTRRKDGQSVIFVEKQ